MSAIKKEIVDEIHKPARKNFKRRRVIIRGLKDLVQADLVEMLPYAKNNKGFRYILMVINAFSKFAWAQPVKQKTGKAVAEAMKIILSQMKYPPKHIQTDSGKEFYNKEFQALMKQHHINHYSTYSSLKASIVERLNRTLKNRMWRQFSLQGSYKWIPILQQVVSEYNNTKHRTVGMKPKDVNLRNAKQVLFRAYSHLKTIDPKTAKFKVGDKVRISKYRHIFSKGYTPNWSNEIFTIRKAQYTNPRTYLLEDHSGEQILGSFYSEELQKVKYPDMYLVEKVLRRKGSKVYVKFLGLNNNHNAWINKSDLYG